MWGPTLVTPEGVAAQNGLLPWAESATLEERVRQEIAQKWRVDPADVVLDWGRVTAESPGEAAEVRLVGGGRNGYWVAGFKTPRTNHWIQVRVRAGVVDRVPVAARDLLRGHILGAEDLFVEEYADWGQPVDRPSAEAIVGWRVQRPVREGEVLQSPAVRPEDAVRSGEVVELIWEGNSVSVSVEGTAIGGGVVGDTIQVRVHQNRRVRASIEAPGRARVIRAGFGG